MLNMIIIVAALIVGQAVVTDGDTIKIGGERIRLMGIDAPEQRHTRRRLLRTSHSHH